MSAEELNDTCRKCVTLTVSDTGAATKALEKMGFNDNVSYKIYQDNRIDIYAQPNITELVHMLDCEGCELLTVKEHDETLEGFFISLVGGGSHD